MPSTLILAGIAFDSYSTPRRMGAGGRQAMVVHKLPGGSRAIDTLGPDEADIVWQGEFFGDDAYQTALVLDGIRAAGQVVTLTWGGQSRLVIVAEFLYLIRREPVWVEYSVVCMVVQNPGLGLLGVVPGGIDRLISSDLSLAAGLL
ncbi:hypothetical protein [Bradyrhizobium lablabi]|uniref:hypothetical protein n=1 Tax=Bradyrhizobium lablabi TaxID=722472 RepID=UPI001BA56A5A|nr:hypothetical protein [Bradyrhizobium lablabi]MBR0693682.1 hypothetical protein [Bradyrhizobium lablabi]